MNKNTFIGFLLIAIILIGFSLLNRPSKEQLEAQRHYRDSVAYAQQLAHEAALQEQKAIEAAETLIAPTTAEDSAVLQKQIEVAYGEFAPAATGQDGYTVMENDLVRLTFANKGGYIYKAELKKYKTYQDSVNYLCLFEGDETELSFTLVTGMNRILHTKNLYFEPTPVRTTEDEAQQLSMRLAVSEESYIEYVYTLPANDYMLHTSIQAVGMQDILAQNMTNMEMHWYQRIRQQEKGRKFEERYATLQ